jgi:hypothetical protein
MTPFGHLAIALLSAAAGRYDRRGLGLCAVGAVLPDLIDKPLFHAGVAPVAHTVGHSVVVLGLVAALLGLSGGRRHRPFLVGWAGHVAADLVVAYPKFTVNYAWPLLNPRPTPDVPLVDYWVEYAVTGFGVVEAALVVGAVLAWRARNERRGRPAESE